jgi:hypothetical protein
VSVLLRHDATEEAGDELSKIVVASKRRLAIPRSNTRGGMRMDHMRDLWAVVDLSLCRHRAGSSQGERDSNEHGRDQRFSEQRFHGELLCLAVKPEENPQR